MANRLTTTASNLEMSSNDTVLGLDVGDVRIGVAAVNMIARLPRPVSVIKNREGVFAEIAEIAKKEGASKIVVGLPRNMAGTETQQTAIIRQFADKLSSQTSLDVTFADESLSTKRAEAMIKEQGLETNQLDAIAACFILEEFLNEAGSQA